MRWIGRMVLAVLSCSSYGQVATAVHLRAPGAALYATVDGTERKIAGAAQKAWLVDSGRTVLYSGLDGAGGYENEGQSLHAYTLADGKDRKIMAEFFVVNTVKELETSAGVAALLVTMTDGGLGASHVAVVNMARGEVFSADGARFLSATGNTIVVGSYRDGDWEKLRSGSKVQPLRTRRYDADELMTRPVLDNKAGS